RDFIGLNVERTSQPLVIDQIEPGLLLQIELYGLRSFEVVIHRYRESDFVVLRQSDGEIEIDEEILEYAKGSTNAAQCAVLRRCRSPQPPGRDRVGKLHG